MIFHFPLSSLPIFDKPIESRLRVDGFSDPSVYIGLLNLFEGRGGVHIQRVIAVALTIVVGLSPAHPIRCILAVFAEWDRVYDEFMRYFLRWTATSELYLGA